MKRPAFALNCISFLRKGGREAGFTMTELLIVVSIIGIISAMAIPSFSSYYDKSCLMAAASEISGMIDEARQRSLCDGHDYGVGFDPATGTVRLIAGKGEDDKWNTADDEVVRSFSLASKGGGLHFGYGPYGPRPDRAAASDGVSFQYNNTLICDHELSGTAGDVYLIARSGSAMAISANSTEYGYKLWRWNGTKWVRL